MAFSDWRCADGYPRADVASIEQWAWEFLRRNPQYQQDWADYAHRCRAVVPGFAQGAELTKDEFRSLLEHESLQVYDPPRLDDETEEGWIRRVGKGVSMSLGGVMADKWGLSSFYDPAREYSPLLSFADRPAAQWLPKHVLERGAYHLEASDQVMVFDLELPLDVQLEQARIFLFAMQKRFQKEGKIELLSAGRQRPDLYPAYLRVLDAEAGNVEVVDIAKELLPHLENSYPDYSASKTVRNYLKAAKAIRDGGYRALIIKHK